MGSRSTERTVQALQFYCSGFCLLLDLKLVKEEMFYIENFNPRLVDVKRQGSLLLPLLSNGDWGDSTFIFLFWGVAKVLSVSTVVSVSLIGIYN